VSLMWPWENRFRFGASLFAADLGYLLDHVVVRDTTDGSVRDYGSIEVGHLDAWGVTWRADALGPRFGPLGRGFASASYGYLRLQADEVGVHVAEANAVGGGLALGIEHSLTPHQTLALLGGVTRLTDEFTRYYGSGSLEWRWHFQAP